MSSIGPDSPDWHRWMTKAHCQAWQAQGGSLRMARPCSANTLDKELLATPRKTLTGVLRGWRRQK